MSIGQFSYIDGFTAIDTIVEDANNPSFDVSDAISKAVATGVSAGATSYLVYALQPYGAMVAVAKTSGQTAEKKPPPATPVVDKQKLTELGEQRAESVKDNLVEKFKVPANRLVNCQPRLQIDKADAIPRTDLLL